MIINLQLLRSAFFFLGELCLSKNGDPVDVDISNKDDGFIKSIALSIRSGVLNTDADISDIVKHIKDRDIWIWKEPYSKEYLAYLDLVELTLEEYNNYKVINIDEFNTTIEYISRFKIFRICTRIN